MKLQDIAQQNATEQDGTQFSAGCLDHLLVKDDKHDRHKDSGGNPRTGEEEDDDSPRTGWCEEVEASSVLFKDYEPAQ